MFKKIAVALDGSACSQQALEVAIGLAQAENAEIGICSVVDPIVIAGTAPPSPAMDLVMRDMESTARTLVTKAVERGHRMQAPRQRADSSRGPGLRGSELRHEFRR